MKQHLLYKHGLVDVSNLGEKFDNSHPAWKSGLLDLHVAVPMSAAVTSSSSSSSTHTGTQTLTSFPPPVHK